MKERNSYIDLCRAIAVLDVLAGHTVFWVFFWETPNYLKSLTLLFEVPAFFFLSGWASSLKPPEMKRSLMSLTRFWMQWIYFILVMAICCVISTRVGYPLSGAEGPADLIQNFFFSVSFKGLPIVSISLWWVAAFFIVIPLATGLLILCKKSRHAGRYELILCFLSAAVFFIWSVLANDIGAGSVYKETLPTMGLPRLHILESSDFGVTIPFLAFFWLLGYNRNKIKIDRLWKLILGEAVAAGAYIVSVKLYGIGWDDIQTAKFPPTVPYFFSSLMLIFLMLYLEAYVKKPLPLLVHIGKNAPFYFFAQGVSSSLCTYIKGYIPGADVVQEAVEAGGISDVRYNPLIILLMFLINILLAILIAEALAFTYGLVKKLVHRLPVGIPWPIPVVIMVFVFVVVFYESVNAPGPFGEWDDYSFPVVSILEEHRISITDDTINGVKEWLFPGWDWVVDLSGFSGMYTADGAELPWYFPLYGIISMPVVLLCRYLAIPPMYAFVAVNIMVVAGALYIAGRFLKCDARRRTLLVLTLAVHPVIFYISNISAEALIYALVVSACTFWYNRWYRRAAVMISLAGMLNPTIMVAGIVMILEYLGQEGFYSDIAGSLKDGKKWIRLFSFGVCFLPSLLPMMYNYYHTGHINLTAATKDLVTGSETTLERMWAYLTDLNYGMLPYFSVLCIIAAILIVAALWKKSKSRYLEWMAVFILNLMLVSTVTHINSGMCAIARYNVWLSVVPIFAIILFGSDIIDEAAVKKTGAAAITVGVLMTGGIIHLYYPHFAMNVQYTEFSPIAGYVLENLPGLYNPIPSTFVARCMQVDGEVDYNTPVIYYGSDGYVRKILATKKDREMLLENYRSAKKSMEWFNDKSFENQVNALSDKPGYISVPARYRVTIRNGGDLLNGVIHDRVE